MASDSSIDKAVADHLSLLNEIAPKFQPNIYPSYLPNLSASSLFITPEQQEIYSQWLGVIKSEGDELMLQTSIDYESRKIIIKKLLKIEGEEERELFSVPKILQLMINSDNHSIKKLKEKFLMLNGYEDETSQTEYDHLFNSTYQAAYSLRVILSNIPGFQVELGGKFLPFEDGNDLVRELEKISKFHRQRTNSTHTNGDNDNENHEEEELEEVGEPDNSSKSTKKRKHKRGGSRK